MEGYPISGEFPMIPVPTALMARFDECLNAKNISDKYHIHYKKWLRFYLDYCAKYQVEPTRRESLESFLQKLRDKKQTVMQQQKASQAVALYYELKANSQQEHLRVAPISPPVAIDKVRPLTTI